MRVYIDTYSYTYKSLCVRIQLLFPITIYIYIYVDMFILSMSSLRLAAHRSDGSSFTPTSEAMETCSRYLAASRTQLCTRLPFGRVVVGFKMCAWTLGQILVHLFIIDRPAGLRISTPLQHLSNRRMLSSVASARSRHQYGGTMICLCFPCRPWGLHRIGVTAALLHQPRRQ